MSDATPVGSSSGTSTGTSTSVKVDAAKVADTYTPAELASSGGWGKFEEFLGKKDFAEFKKNLCSQISTQIKHEEQMAQKSAQETKNVIEGRDPTDDG